MNNGHKLRIILGIIAMALVTIEFLQLVEILIKVANWPIRLASIPFLTVIVIAIIYLADYTRYEATKCPRRFGEKV